MASLVLKNCKFAHVIGRNSNKYLGVLSTRLQNLNIGETPSRSASGSGKNSEHGVTVDCKVRGINILRDPMINKVHPPMI